MQFFVTNSCVSLLARSVLALLLVAHLASATITRANVIGQANDAPELLTYAELGALYDGENTPAPLERKLNQLLSVPFVDNSHAAGSRLRLSQTPQLGEFLRVAFWNIERGLESKRLKRRSVMKRVSPHR